MKPKSLLPRRALKPGKSFAVWKQPFDREDWFFVTGGLTLQAAKEACERLSKCNQNAAFEVRPEAAETE